MKIIALKIVALFALLFSLAVAGVAQPIVCVDPGHPSETSAGANQNGLSENLLNWQVALEMKPILESLGFRVVLTKSSLNQLVTNKRRAEIANGDNAFKKPAALFIRLHCDVGSGSGFAWYYPDRQGRKGNFVGPPRDVIQKSRVAALRINQTMTPILRPYLRSNPVKTDASTYVGAKQGGVLTGSIYSRVPTALIEMCFINRKRDAQFIASPQGRKIMARAISLGIKSALGSPAS